MMETGSRGPGSPDARTSPGVSASPRLESGPDVPLNAGAAETPASARPSYPTAITERQALVLSLALAPALAIPVTWALQQPVSLSPSYLSIWSPVDPLALFICVAAAALASVAIGAGIGGRISRRWAFLGALWAVVIGWTAAVSLTTVVTALAAVPLQAGWVCIDSCDPSIDGAEAASGIKAVWGGWIMAAFFGLPPVVALLGLGVAAVLSRGHRVLAVLVLLAALATINVLALTAGALVPYLCFTIGVTAWAWVLHGRPLVVVPRGRSG
jgi:hypothetical protein